MRLLLFSLIILFFQPERHVIMQVICEATQCPETLVKVGGLIIDWLSVQSRLQYSFPSLTTLQ